MWFHSKGDYFIMENNYKINFGKRLKKERKLRKLTQEQMAEKLDISLKHYGAVERGLTGLSTENLIHLSDILGLSLDYLLKGENSGDISPLNEVSELYLSCPPSKRIYLLEVLRSAVQLSLDAFPKQEPEDTSK